MWVPNIIFQPIFGPCCCAHHWVTEVGGTLQCRPTTWDRVGAMQKVTWMILQLPNYQKPSCIFFVMSVACQPFRFFFLLSSLMASQHLGFFFFYFIGQVFSFHTITHVIWESLSMCHTCAVEPQSPCCEPGPKPSLQFLEVVEKVV